MIVPLPETTLSTREVTEDCPLASKKTAAFEGGFLDLEFEVAAPFLLCAAMRSAVRVQQAVSKKTI